MRRIMTKVMLAIALVITAGTVVPTTAQAEIYSCIGHLESNSYYAYCNGDGLSWYRAAVMCADSGTGLWYTNYGFYVPAEPDFTTSSAAYCDGVDSALIGWSEEL